MDTNCDNWLCRLADDTMMKAMKTLSNTLDESEKDLTPDEIDDIHHLWEIIHEVLMVKEMTAKETN